MTEEQQKDSMVMAVIMQPAIEEAAKIELAKEATPQEVK